MSRPLEETPSASSELASRNRLLRGIIELTSTDADLREVARGVADLVVEATGSDVCFVHAVDEERHRLALIGATPPFDHLAGTIELAVGEGIAGWVAAHARPALVPDKWQDRRYRYIPELRGEDYASLVSVPMLVGRRVVGVLNVHARRPRAHHDGHLALLTQVAELLARAVENARLRERLAEREATLERFATRTVEAQESERRRLAGEIHDGISQPLISLWFHLLAAEDAAERPDDVRRELAAARAVATTALDEARAAISALRPSVLDDLGLAPSVESLARGLVGVDVAIDVAPCRLPPHAEVALYRIAQEAVQNVVKHAGASHVQVSLGTIGDTVRLVVQDDGRGFELEDALNLEERRSYGLVGMRERAELIDARLTVTSQPGKGTTVQVVVPAGAAD